MSSARSYAIIGAGMMGCEHIRNLALLDDAHLVALADPHPHSLTAAAALANQYGDTPDCYSDIQEMLQAKKPDAVIIASPNHTHFDVMQQVMPHSPAILLEKPMCTAGEDARALHDLVQGYTPPVWIGLEYRYMPPVSAFIRRVHAGETGPVKMLSIREHRFPFLPKVGDWNRFNRNSGGTLVEKCCHFFDLMRLILQDEPVRIFASGAQDVNHLDEQYGGEVPDIIDNAYVLVDFAGGGRAVLDLCMFAEGSEQQEEIYALGPTGKMEVKIPAGDIVWSPRDVSGAVRTHIDVPKSAMQAGDHHGATWFQLQDFHAALTNGTPPLVTSLDGLRSVQMGLAAQQSIATGLPVPLGFGGGI
ncbi:Gfo/Idh/MocA family oxidoreductase [Sphingorhabdus sp. Alg239-R122]|uniref:Gfo/Idh/MocA family protein n=1 Tax=Sphingorhabdus sp. Alg239-R122 TaxID=2305989 RepID=UPI0013DB3A52|nr:Gfo/Idh/MocA family oxidoreductase [Sphingorhabdus sp. Alg239-R122]